MLSNDLLTINKIVQADISGLEGIDWFRHLDMVKQREVVSILKNCIEQADPNQAGVDKVRDRWQRLVSPEVVKIFAINPYQQALDKATKAPDQELGNCYVLMIEVLRHFDEVQRKTVCKDGCDHEWHNLTWVIKTDKVDEVVHFYSSLGLKPEYRKHGSGFVYTISNGQSLLKIYQLPKTKKDKGLALRIKFFIEDFDGVIKRLEEKKLSFSRESDTTITVNDPDGRRIQLQRK